MNTTYSFADVTLTINHPKVGKYIASGGGIGSINLSMSNDRTVHDIAADGSVMVSKIRARNGQLSLAIQQTSPLNKWLTKWFNYLETASTSAWADTTVTIRCPVMGDSKILTGVSPQKQADVPYQAQGQQVTWNLMAADIQQEAA